MLQSHWLESTIIARVLLLDCSVPDAEHEWWGEPKMPGGTSG